MYRSVGYGIQTRGNKFIKTYTIPFNQKEIATPHTYRYSTPLLNITSEYNSCPLATEFRIFHNIWIAVILLGVRFTHSNMSNLSQVHEINLNYFTEGLKPLFEEFEREVETSGDGKTEQGRERRYNARLKKTSESICKLLVDLLSGVHKTCEDNTNDLNAKNSKQDESHDKLEEELIYSKIENDQQQQRLKSDTIRIHNVSVPPQAQNGREDVTNTVLEYFSDANIAMERADIKSAFRPMKDGVKGSNIYVSFLRGFDRIKVLKQRKAKMTDNTEFQRKRHGSFITEDLTPLRQHIAYKLRQDKLRIKKSWSIDGKIKCIKQGMGDNDKPISIDTPYDLTKVGWEPSEVKQFIRDNLLKKQA